MCGVDNFYFRVEAIALQKKGESILNWETGEEPFRSVVVCVVTYICGEGHTKQAVSHTKKLEWELQCFVRNKNRNKVARKAHREMRTPEKYETEYKNTT